MPYVSAENANGSRIDSRCGSVDRRTFSVEVAVEVIRSDPGQKRRGAAFLRFPVVFRGGPSAPEGGTPGSAAYPGVGRGIPAI